jgi:hypothetical protein
MPSTTTFAYIETTDIQELAKKRASSSTILVYTTLLTFARQKSSCFPSIATIRKALCNAYGRSTIYEALAWLKAHNFIKTGKPRSKDRFKIVSRLLQRARQALQETVQKSGNDRPASRTIKPTKKNTPFLRGRKQRKSSKENVPQWRKSGSYERWGKTDDNAYENDAQRAWSDFAYAVWPPNLYKATESQKKLLCREILHGSSLDWAVEQHPHIKQQAMELYTEAL